MLFYNIAQWWSLAFEVNAHLNVVQLPCPVGGKHVLLDLDLPDGHKVGLPHVAVHALVVHLSARVISPKREGLPIVREKVLETDFHRSHDDCGRADKHREDS